MNVKLALWSELDKVLYLALPPPINQNQFTLAFKAGAECGYYEWVLDSVFYWFQITLDFFC